MAFKDYPIAMLVIALVIILVFAFAVSFVNQYGFSSNIISTGQINFTGLEQQLNRTSTEATNWQTAFTSDNPLISVAGLILFSIWGIFKSVWNAMTLILQILVNGVVSILGIPPIVVGVIFAIFIIIIIFAGWKLIKIGE